MYCLRPKSGISTKKRNPALLCRSQALLPKKPCDIPVWALARDARYVLAVEALSTKIEKDQEFDREMARVRVVT
jgi:hypothetical protein